MISIISLIIIGTTDVTAGCAVIILNRVCVCVTVTVTVTVTVEKMKIREVPARWLRWRRQEGAFCNKRQATQPFLRNHAPDLLVHF